MKYSDKVILGLYLGTLAVPFLPRIHFSNHPQVATMDEIVVCDNGNVQTIGKQFKWADRTTSLKLYTTVKVFPAQSRLDPLTGTFHSLEDGSTLTVRAGEPGPVTTLPQRDHELSDNHRR